MTHTIVLSDAAPARLDDGRTLAKFLRLFAPNDTRVVTVADVVDGRVAPTDRLYVAQPSTLTAGQAAAVSAGEIVAFDYFDEPEPRWSPETADGWRPMVRRYLKTHRRTDARHDGLAIGLLPIAYNPAVAKNYGRWRRRGWWRALERVAGRPERPWDVSFLGSCTYLESRAPDGSMARYHQRVQWWREIVSHPEWRSWGGLSELPYCTLADVERAEGPSARLFRQERPIRFKQYFRQLAETKVSLAPAGHARWTYRHVESVYAGCDIVSNDLRNVETLVPAPLEHMVFVSDHDAVAPAVAAALAAHQARGPHRLAAFEHIEMWLRHGQFAAERRRPFEAFVSQFSA